MVLEKTIQVLNQMADDGVFHKYAIGGGIAALFYIEPVATFDLDIFFIPTDNPAGLVSLSGLYQWLDARGYRTVKEQVVIEGVPVQFIPVYDEVVEAGVKDAIGKKVGLATTFVLRPEYLMAIMLKTFRPKDKERLARFLSEGSFDEDMLARVLHEHNLTEAYERFRR